MKIYANKQADFKTPFDEYIGKAVFVKCWMFEEIVYVRFLAKEYYTPFRNKTIPVLRIAYFDYGELPNIEEHIDWLCNITKIEPSNLSLYSPHKVIPANTLYDKPNSCNILQNFVGTNIWIKVNTTDTRHTLCDCYINVVSIANDIVTYHWIVRSDFEHIENGDYIGVYSRAAFDSIFIDTLEAYIDGITVYEPLEILTTEEIIEMANSYGKGVSEE